MSRHLVFSIAPTHPHIQFLVGVMHLLSIRPSFFPMADLLHIAEDTGLKDNRKHHMLPPVALRHHFYLHCARSLLRHYPQDILSWRRGHQSPMIGHRVCYTPVHIDVPCQQIAMHLSIGPITDISVSYPISSFMLFSFSIWSHNAVAFLRFILDLTLQLMSRVLFTYVVAFDPISSRGACCASVCLSIMVLIRLSSCTNRSHEPKQLKYSAILWSH